MIDKLPLAIEIEINSHCNLSCAYCPNSKFERVEKGVMSLESYEKIMKELHKHNYGGRISFHFYNEPTLHPHLEQITELTKRYLPKSLTELYSNGTELNEKNILALSKLGMDKFNLTEHAKTSLDQIDQIKESFPELKSRISKMSFKKLTLTNRGGSLKNLGKKLTEPLKVPCFIPKCTMVITLKGNIVPCYEDYFQNHVMGNIFEQDLMEIWNSPKYVEFRNLLKLGQRKDFEVCKDCNNLMIIN